MGTLRLLDSDGTTELLNLPGQAGDPIYVTQLDLGFPDVRDDTEDSAEADGTQDDTLYVGARGITAAFTARDAASVELLTALAHPGRRLWLHVQSTGWDAERRILVRPADLQAPFGAGAFVEGQMQWKAPAGVFEAVDETVVDIAPAGIGEPGLAEPIFEPVSVPASYLPGETDLTVPGTVGCWPIIDIYGPCTDPQVSNLTTGKTVSLPGVSIAAGRFLRIDMGARTITADGDPSLSRYGEMDFTVSRWWSLLPGANTLLLSLGSPGAGCIGRLTCRPRFM